MPRDLLGEILERVRRLSETGGSDVVLVKASRFMGLERVVARLASGGEG